MRISDTMRAALVSIPVEPVLGWPVEPGPALPVDTGPSFYRPGAGRVVVIREALVTGGRGYHPTHADAWWLRDQLIKWQIGRVLQGEARHDCGEPGCRRDSLDQWAARVARRLGLEALGFRPEGRAREDYLERNLVMLDRDPSVVFAFPGGSGTGHTVTNARRRLIPVVARVEALG